MALTALTGTSLLLISAPKPPFTIHQKAYYASPEAVNFVRPGLVMKIFAADVASDGTIHAHFRLSDPKGLPLDLAGVTTPGAVTVSFVASFIPKGQTQYQAYSTRVFTNKKTGATVTDPWVDAGGTFTKTADGEYLYTFNAKAPATFDASVTHTIGGQASRDLTEFDMGKYVDNDVFNFVPDGSPVTVVRDVVRTATCNARCHDPLAVHGRNRIKVELCVLCHQPQNQDPYGGSLNFPVIIHRIHSGSSLPSVVAGQPLMINNNDFSDVVFPAGVRNCEVCHDANSGAAQAQAWLNPNRAACGSCHDDVNFTTGQNHVNLPQIDDNLCANCHVPQGELEFDASIKGAHLDPRFSKDLPGVIFNIVSVDGARGKQPTVTFTIQDKTGTPIAPASMTRLSLVLSGPTADYQGMVSESAKGAQASSDGKTYQYTFSGPIAPDAVGTYAIGIEGYRNITLLPGTVKAMTVRDAGMNQISYFSVDGSPVQPRRTVVSIDKCNACHLKLEMHGSLRNQTDHCVQCHNVNATDAAGRPKDQAPAETIAFKTMIHRIHTGENLTTPYVIYGGSGKPTDFSSVVFPGDRRDCAKCHVNNSYQLPLPDGVADVVDPRSPVNPMGPASAACMGCHTGSAVASHVVTMTTTIGESCDVCHGNSAEFSIDRVHAR